MARCCGNTCSCKVVAGSRISVLGTGAANDPFVIATDTGFSVIDTDVINLTLNGNGSAASPWTLSATFAATAQLTDLPDVNAVGPTNGQVLGWDSSVGRWTARSPVTASAGSVLHDTSLTGDGSSGSPLQVNEDPNGYLTTAGAGLGISDTGKNQMVRRFANTGARAVASPPPVLNSLSELDTNPGVIDYWTGSQWLPVKGAVTPDGSGQQLLALSGGYSNQPLTMVVRSFTGVTSAEGSLTVLGSTLLSGKAGVLTASVTVTGAQAYLPVLVPGTDRVDVVARRIDTGAVLGGQSISGQITAYVY